MEPKPTDIAQILRLIAELTSQASALAAEALHHAEAGRTNAAIGTLVEVNQLCSDANTLGTAAVILHRRRDGER